MYSIGIDSGSATTKGVLYDGKGILKKSIVLTGPNPRKTIQALHDDLSEGLHKNSLITTTTGYGRALLDSADNQITEITCHGIGARFLEPNAESVIDIGGQDSKVIKLSSDNRVVDFLMNDKCAAGTGRFVEVIMRLLGEDIDQLDSYVAGATAIKVNSMCTVFAESEVIGLLAQDVHGSDIALGMIESIAERTANFARRINPEGNIFFSGGLARFECFRGRLETKLTRRVITHELSQYCGAIGAAIKGYR